VKPARLVVGALATVVLVTYAGNCVKNVVVGARVAKVCPALLASATERLENSRDLFSRLFEADAAAIERLPQAIVGQTCGRLSTELDWYKWNLGRTVRMDETRAERQRLIALIDRTLPVCVERATRGIDPQDTLHTELATPACHMLKTLRTTLDSPVQDASPWALAEQLERLTPVKR
jgi:hypothetical protein